MKLLQISQNKVSVQFSSVIQSCLTLCDPMDCSTPGLPVHHQLLEFTQTHVHWIHDAIQPSHPLSSPSPSTCNLYQQQSVFQWVSSSHQVAKSIGASASASVLPVKMSLAIISIKCNKIVALASKFGGSLCNNIYVDHIYSIKTHYSCFLLLYLMFHCKWHLFNFKWNAKLLCIICVCMSILLTFSSIKLNCVL